MTIRVTVQTAVSIAADAPWLPAGRDVRRWARAALQGQRDRAQLTVRIVDRAESAQLNETYRHKPGPTNVLSFPMDQPELLDPPLLGDIVICAPVVADEAVAQHKTPRAHWAHLVVHGILHLVGYDHGDPIQAQEMEILEISILKQFDIGNPYDAAGESRFNRL